MTWPRLWIQKAELERLKLEFRGPGALARCFWVMGKYDNRQPIGGFQWQPVTTCLITDVVISIMCLPLHCKHPSDPLLYLQARMTQPETSQTPKSQLVGCISSLQIICSSHHTWGPCCTSPWPGMGVWPLSIVRRNDHAVRLLSFPPPTSSAIIMMF